MSGVQNSRAAVQSASRIQSCSAAFKGMHPKMGQTFSLPFKPFIHLNLMTATTKQFCALLILCALHASTSFAQTSRQFTLLLQDRTPSAITPQSEKDGGIDVAMLTCYLPDVPSGRAIVCCPGGGYSHLAMQHEGHNWAEFFTAKGIAFFVLKYRMPNGDRNIPLGDAYEAFRLVRDSAKVWGINPSDVGIMGFSAGGHLASAVSRRCTPQLLHSLLSRYLDGREDYPPRLCPWIPR